MIGINAVIDGIGVALNREFGDKYAVYAEEIKQGLSEPCFFISCISPSDRQMMGNANSHFLAARYFRENRFCIQFFPEDKNNGRRESYDIAERLFTSLEIIKADEDLIRGTNMNFEYVDDVLSFFVSYNFFVYRTRKPVVMEDLSKSVKTKG